MSRPNRLTSKWAAFAAALVALSALVAVPAATRAQTSGTLKIQVVNRTPGATQPGNLPLFIYQVQNGAQVLTAQGQTDATGSYAANNLLASTGASYVITTTYKGVAYKTEAITLPASSAELPVYETTDDDSKIRIANAGVVILGVDGEAQRISFLETATLLNSGDRTFLPSAAGSRGPMGLLRFGLPSGAGNLIVGEGLTNSSVIQVDTGFATDMPVPPGNTNVSFAYQMAYGALPDPQGGYAQVSRTMPYPVDFLRVMAVPGDFRIESTLLTDDGSVTVGSRTYRQFSAKDLPANSEVSFDLRNLPLVLPVLRPGNPWLQLIIGALALAAILIPVLYRRKQRGYVEGQVVAPTPRPANNAAEAVALKTGSTPVRRIAGRPPNSGDSQI